MTIIRQQTPLSDARIKKTPAGLAAHGHNLAYVTANARRIVHFWKVGERHRHVPATGAARRAGAWYREKHVMWRTPAMLQLAKSEL